MTRNTLAEKIIEMAEMRGVDKTICPSEVARELFPGSWRKHMQEIREETVALEREGKVVIKQKGKRIEPKQLKGPIRIQIAPGT